MVSLFNYLNVDQYKYRDKQINFSGFLNGQYKFLISIPLVGDVNPLDNIAERYVNVIPEPTTLALLTAGAIALKRKKRR